MNLSGRAVIVTGASSGIGEAVARKLADLGAGVVVNSSSSVEAGTKVAESLPDAVYVQGDIGDPATAEQLVGAARERWGRLDGLVNNAGCTIDVPLKDLGDVTAEHWDKVLRTNVTGTFLVTQAALPLLRESDDGWVLNVGSVAGVRQIGSAFPYSVSKAAIHQMTGLFAKLAGGEVRVNAVAPGLIDTPWTADWAAMKEGVSAMAPLGRVGTPEDVVEACMGLIGATYATGQIFVVDGGLTLTV
jgi:ketoreductase RED2